MYLGLKKSSVSIAMLVGITFYIFGLVFMFDRLFLLIGNLLFLVGASYSAGFFTLLMFFIKPSKIKGSICYFVGLFMILTGWALIGGLLQLFGIFHLFRDFIPQIYASSKYIPGIGPYICSSAILKDIIAKISDTKVNKV